MMHNITLQTIPSMGWGMLVRGLEPITDSPVKKAGAQAGWDTSPLQGKGTQSHSMGSGGTPINPTA